MGVIGLIGSELFFLDLGYSAGDCGMHGLRLGMINIMLFSWIHVGIYDVSGRYPV